MKKMLALMLAAALSLLTLTAEAGDTPDPEFGYFYLEDGQFVQACFGTVSWEHAGSVHTDDVFIDSSNNDRIILKKKGYYLATFTLTGRVSNPVGATANAPAPAASTPAIIDGICCQKFQFALYLNEGDDPIPGSTYAGSTLFFSDPPSAQTEGSCNTEVVGQVIFRVSDRNSFIQLVNQSENSVLLDDNAGTSNREKFGDNVAVSIAIQRLSGLNID
ncbi:MAG: hypothetical protein LLG04_04605 [Parachlamydia sp.]|nr:hypothetical protein [Parachlamydia sp.]